MRLILLIFTLVLVSGCSTQQKKIAQKEISRKLATNSSWGSQLVSGTDSWRIEFNKKFKKPRNVSENDWEEFVHIERFGIVRPPSVTSKVHDIILDIQSEDEYYSDLLKPWRNQVKYMSSVTRKKINYNYPEAYKQYWCESLGLDSQKCKDTGPNSFLADSDLLKFKDVMRQKSIKHMGDIFIVLLNISAPSKNNPNLLEDRSKCVPAAEHFRFSLPLFKSSGFCGKEWAREKLELLEDHKSSTLLNLLSLSEIGLKDSKRPVLNTNSPAYRWLVYMASIYPGSVAGANVAKGDEANYSRQLIRALFWKKPGDIKEPYSSEREERYPRASRELILKADEI